MGFISQSTIEQILSSSDIVELVESYFPLKRSGNSLKACCPFHQEKTPSFIVTPARQRYHCFGCGADGSIINFVMNYENLSFPEALRKLAQRANITIEEEVSTPQQAQRKEQKSRLLEIHSAATEWFHQLLLKDPKAQLARDHLKQRGIDINTAKTWKIGWVPKQTQLFFDWAKSQEFKNDDLIACGLSALKEENTPSAGLYLRFSNRLIFPIVSDYDEIIAFSGRQLVEDPRSGKYINSPETPIFIKSKAIFGLHRAKRAILKAKHALICEGQIDVIQCASHGIEQAIAPLGTALTKDHANLIKRYTDEVILCFDHDPSGLKATERAFMELAQFSIQVKVLALPEGADPDDFLRKQGAEAFQKALLNAKDFFDFQLQNKLNEKQLGAFEKAKVAQKFKQWIDAISDPLLRDSYCQSVATSLRLDVNSFKSSSPKSQQKTYQPKQIAQKPQLENYTVDRNIAILCKLAMESDETRFYLIDIQSSFEPFRLYLPGLELLEIILTKHPSIHNMAKQNLFLDELDPAFRKILIELQQTPPLEPSLSIAKTIYAEIFKNCLQKQLTEKISSLSQSGLSQKTLTKLQKEILDLEQDITRY